MSKLPSRYEFQWLYWGRFILNVVLGTFAFLHPDHHSCKACQWFRREQDLFRGKAFAGTRPAEPQDRESDYALWTSRFNYNLWFPLDFLFASDTTDQYNLENSVTVSPSSKLTLEKGIKRRCALRVYGNWYHWSRWSAHQCFLIWFFQARF